MRSGFGNRDFSCYSCEACLRSLMLVRKLEASGRMPDRATTRRHSFSSFKPPDELPHP
jgi:hypothetical protein